METGKGNILSLFRSPLICVSVFLITIGACAISFIAPTLSLHLLELNLSPMEISLFYMIVPILHALLAPVWGYVSDKWDVQSVQLPLASLFCAIGFLLLGPTPLIPFLPQKKVWLTVLGLVVFGFFFGNTAIPTMKCFFVGTREIGMPENLNTKGLVSGLFYAAFYLGAFIGPTIAGVLMQHFGFEYACTVIAGTFLIGAIVSTAFFMYRRIHRHKMESMESNSADHN
ncbi:MFS-type transporter slc18b1-like [Plakobranchus ocellatus]|uniref:MFS-type transporter slc18b1-like n=1 Tax=Plakobranchus ocellatus TaxID=259542 RepID=A0AAV3Y5D4_9GAST|nr:MFS-type transporter slc18b1-like [Plakobranchus ocellatus]